MQATSTLPAILASIWQLLSEGASQKQNPLHTPTIGTIDNHFPQLRTVILRQTVIEHRTLYFYTDSRSEKRQQLSANPALSWLFYHPEKKVQIRAIGKAIIHYQNLLTLEHWQLLSTYSRKTYSTIQAPSTPLLHVSDDLPPVWKTSTITLADTEYAYVNFAVIACKIHQLEWLNLQRSGHQRAQFNFEHGDWNGHWMVP